MGIDATVLEWGNSLGIRLSKKDAKRLNVHANEKVIVEIKHRDNPLTELFGFSKRAGKKITKKDILKIEKMSQRQAMELDGMP